MFNACQDLTVMIPATVTNIGEGSFSTIRSLTINYYGTETDWQQINIADDAFSSTFSNTIVYNYTGD